MPKGPIKHIALTAYDLENGGISRVAVYLANGFAEAGHKVTLLLCTSAGERDADLRALLRPDVTYEALSNRRYASRALGQIACLPGFRRWLKTHRPDIVMGTANNIAWFSGGGLAGKNAPECELYIKTTNPIIREEDSALITGLRRLGYNCLFARANKILTLSDAESQILATEFPPHTARFESVYNPYVTDALLSLELAGRRDADTPFKILTLGRFSPQKNMARSIAAFALANKRDLERGGKRMTSATLTIAGEGPELEARKADAGRLGLSDQVHFPGFTNDVSGLLADAHLFVLSSNYEGLPAVVLEALGSGCPVVSTDCFPAARELLSGLAGCVVTERSPESLADGILAAVAVEPDRQQLRARAANYSVDSAVQSHLKAMGLKAS